MSWTLTQIRTYMRLHLAGATTPSDDEIGRAWIHALSDFSRFVPREMIKEYTLDYDEVADEQVTLTAHGTFIAMANKPVKWASERICNDAAETTTYVRDKDYTIDYSNGEITSISSTDGGAISATATIFCNYTVSRHTIDISALTDLIRVNRVEYPVGNVPQHFATFELYGGLLTVTRHPNDKPNEAQHELSDKRHLAVYYHDTHTAPDTTTGGSAPNWSNEILLKGCEAYSWLIRAIGLETNAITDLDLATAAMGKAWTDADTDTGALIEAEAALGAATDTLALITTSSFHADANVSLGLALDELAKLVDVDGTPTTGELYAAMNVTDCAPGTEGAVYLTSIDTPPSSHDYLIDGDDTIATVNVGEAVAAENRAYAESAGKLHDRLRDLVRLHLERGTLHMQVIMGYVQEAQVRLSHIDKHNAEAQAEISVGSGYTRAAETYAMIASQHVANAAHKLQLAVLYRQTGISRRNEFWSILVSKHQLGTDKHSTQRS